MVHQLSNMILLKQPTDLEIMRTDPHQLILISRLELISVDSLVQQQLNCASDGCS